MGLFSGIENAERSKGGLYLTEGVYQDLEILEVKMIESRKGDDFFCVELLVHRSTGELAVRSGQRPTWMIKADKAYWETFLGNVKAFVAEAADCKDEEIDEAGVEAMLSSKQPLRGTHVSAEAFNIKTKAGGDFTKVTWARMPKGWKSPAKAASEEIPF